MQYKLKKKRTRHATSELDPSPEDEDLESEEAEGQPVGSAGGPQEDPMRRTNLRQRRGKFKRSSRQLR